LLTDKENARLKREPGIAIIVRATSLRLRGAGRNRTGEYTMPVRKIGIESSRADLYRDVARDRHS